MSNQQKDNQASGGSGAGQGLRRKEKDDTGGPRGDELSNAVGAAAAGGTGRGEANSADDASLTGGDPSKGSIPPPTNKGGASSA